MDFIEKQAYFYDNKNNLQYAEILITKNKFLGIKTFNENNVPTGYMHIFVHPNNSLFLDTIYCYDEFRSSGIATIINELAEYLLKDYIGYKIIGEYKPGQLSTDRNIKRSKEELDNKARSFYLKNGYQIIKYTDYLKNKDKYDYINSKDFIKENISDTIVAKKLKEKEYSFYEEDGIIYHNNYIKENIKRL